MPTDTFSLIRSLLESNQQEVANAAVAEDDEKVLTRSCKSFVTERPKKSWDDYERRSAHRHTGFDSIPHVPYRPFAGLKHIDAYPLVADTWRVRLDRPNNSEERVKNSRKRSVRSSRQPSNHHYTVEVVNDCPSVDGKEMTRTKSRTGGLSSLQLHLGSTSRTIKEVSAGSALFDTLPREETRKNSLKRMKAPKRRTIWDGSSVLVHNPSIFLPLLPLTASSKACLISKRQNQKVPTSSKEESNLVPQDTEEEIETPSLCHKVGHVAMAAVQFKMNQQSRKKESISQARRLQMRSCVIKVKTIYSVLCSLYNMKTKDLKEKRPLSMEVVKQMSMKPVLREGGSHLHGRRLTGHSTYNNHSRAPSFHSHTKRNVGVVESWQDLLMLAGQQTGNHSSTSSSPPHHCHSQSGHPQLRVILPWQRKVVSVDNNEIRGNDPGVKINKCLLTFQEAKDSVSKKTESLLAKRNNNNVRSMAVKAESLRLGVDRERCLREMRETAYNISSSERAKQRNRPAWYLKLEKEVGMNFKPSLVTDDWQLHVWKTVAKWFLQRIEFFAFSDIESRPRVLEKLCLLVMSLPPDQLCLAPVLESIQFVLEAVLELPAKLCRTWLEMRGLPVNGVPLPKKPVIVLGLTVNA